MTARVLFVCTGNICRSPMAEAVLRRMADAAGRAVDIDSAGTGGWHVGAPPDARAAAAAVRRGFDIAGISARRVSPADFGKFDRIYAMAREHHNFLSRMAPPAAAGKVHMFLAAARGDAAGDVPDPYFGGAAGFEEMMDLLEEGCAAILKDLPPAGAAD